MRVYGAFGDGLIWVGTTSYAGDAWPLLVIEGDALREVYRPRVIPVETEPGLVTSETIVALERGQNPFWLPDFDFIGPFAHIETKGQKETQHGHV